MARSGYDSISRYGRDYLRSYLDRLELADRMGVHDFAERYGRYSGGSPRSYEVSEQSIEHRRGRGQTMTGFTRTLMPPRIARGGPRPMERSPRRGGYAREYRSVRRRRRGWSGGRGGYRW
jgi:hypothetical protein